MEAYLRGLERRVAARLPVDQIRSVASLFVSRTDVTLPQPAHACREKHPGADAVRLCGFA